MIRSGQVVLFRFPQTDQMVGKLRPALIVAPLPGPHDDWLICMISSRLSQQVEGFDELIASNEVDYASSGLKHVSVI